MDSTKMYRILAYGCFFLLIVLEDPAEACMCSFEHPQSAYCYSGFVIRAKFLGETMQRAWKIYEIKTVKVYKGPKTLKELRFLYTSRRESLCGYQHKGPFHGEEYVIAGKKNADRVRISLCSFIQPWAWLSPEQKKGLLWNYSKGCSCEIKSCYFNRCTKKSSNKCLWDQRLYGTHAKSLACLPKSKNSDSCSWQSLN